MQQQLAAATPAANEGHARAKARGANNKQEKASAVTKPASATAHARWVPRPADLGAALPGHGCMRRKRMQTVCFEACTRTSYVAVTTPLSALHRPLLFDLSITRDMHV